MVSLANTKMLQLCSGSQQCDWVIGCNTNARLTSQPSSHLFLPPELQPSEHLLVEGSIWLPLNVVSNGNASSSSQAVGVTKIAKSVIAPLAEQHVSVFMLSTYQTDFILVSECVAIGYSKLYVILSSVNKQHS